MKRYLNYLLVLSNILIFIGVIIGLGLLINYKNNLLGEGNVVGGNLTRPDVLDKMQWVVFSPIAFLIASCSILFFYQWKIREIIKKNENEFNIKMLNTIKIVSLSSVVNYIITCLLGIVGCLVKDITLESQTILFAIAIGFSGIFGLIVIGIVSYLNLRISFEESKKNQTLNTTEESTNVTDLQSKKSTSNKDDERVTSGSF